MSIIETSPTFTQETSVGLTNAAGHSQIPWMEMSVLVIGILIGYAATCQFATRDSKPSESTQSKASPSTHKTKALGNRMGFQCEPSVEEEASILLQQGKVKAAVSLLQKLPELSSPEGCLPTRAARSVLLTAMRTMKVNDVGSRSPKLRSMMSDLEPLKGSIGAGPLEQLIVEAGGKKDAECCRQLHALSCMLHIPKSQLTFETLAHAYAFDAKQLRGLVEEAEKPLAAPFAKIVLQACSVMKDADLGGHVLAQVNASEKAYLGGLIGQAPATAKAADAEKSIKHVNSSPRTTSAGSDSSNSAPSSPRSSATQDESNADANSYEEKMKVYLASGKEAEAKQLLDELTSKELATASSYHGLLSMRIGAEDKRGAWRLVADMQMNGISPDCKTCSILLTGKLESVEEVSRVLVLVDTMEEPMDDALFMALADSCIGVGRLDVLSKQFQKFQGSLSGQTFGSMIKAYGRAHDMKRVWSLWEQTSSQQVPFTALIIFYMVEALVINGLTAKAWALVQGLNENAQLLLDTPIYSTILKGFASLQSIDKVVEVYGAMKARQIQANGPAFNAILTAMVQCATMQHVPAVLADMRAAAVEPDLATYCALVKGYCNVGQLDRAVHIFEEVKSAGKCEPGDKMYKSLVDGCIKALAMRAHLASPGHHSGCLDEVVAALGGAESEQGASLLSALQR